MMETAFALLALAMFMAFTFLCLNFTAKRQAEMDERRSHIIGTHIAEAIKSSVKDMNK